MKRPYGNQDTTQYVAAVSPIVRPRIIMRRRMLWAMTALSILSLVTSLAVFRHAAPAHASGSYLTSFTGISSSQPGPNNTGVQDFIQSALVQPDGTIWTYSAWDEGGHQFGEYKDGQQVEPLPDGNHHNLTNDSSRSVTDNNGVTWAIQNAKYVGGDSVCRTDNTSVCITGSNGFRPNALAIANDGTLMVGDNGPDQQIKFYDVSSGNPSSTPVRTFGDQGGVWAGPTPGLTGPTRFSGIWGVGQDSSGNIYVIGNFPGGGTWMRSLTPDGNMNWQLYGKIWVSNVAPDASTDGTVVYDHNAEYRMDYSQTDPGKETVGDFPYAVTIDPWNHPDDPRLSTYDCCDANNNGTYQQDTQASTNAHYSFTFFTPKWIRDVDGHKFMITQGMFSGELGLYEWDGNYWVSKSFVNGPGTGSDKWPWSTYVDTNGDLWLAWTHAGSTADIIKYPATGVDGSGNIVYGNVVTYSTINDFNEVTRIRYDRQKDILYVAGFTNDRPRGGGWGDVGTVFKSYSQWSSSPTNTLTINLPYYYATYPNGDQDFVDSISGQDIEIAGNYLIFGMGTNNDDTGQHGSPAIFSLADGSRTDLVPTGAFTGDDVGWLDTFGVTAMQRSNGEYLIFIEDDYKNKSVLYRWNP